MFALISFLSPSATATVATTVDSVFRSLVVNDACRHCYSCPFSFVGLLLLRINSLDWPHSRWLSIRFYTLVTSEWSAVPESLDKFYCFFNSFSLFLQIGQAWWICAPFVGKKKNTRLVLLRVFFLFLVVRVCIAFFHRCRRFALAKRGNSVRSPITVSHLLQTHISYSSPVGVFILSVKSEPESERFSVETTYPHSTKYKQTLSHPST